LIKAIAALLAGLLFNLGLDQLTGAVVALPADLLFNPRLDQLTGAVVALLADLLFDPGLDQLIRPEQWWPYCPAYYSIQDWIN